LTPLLSLAASKIRFFYNFSGHFANLINSQVVFIGWLFFTGTGKAVAFSGDASGIPDLTGAKDLTSGTAIPLNHHLLFPREGRGIQLAPKEKNSVVVMVRGPYELVNAEDAG
jgi:hypothetical protein